MSSLICSNGGPCWSKPLVRSSKPVGASVIFHAGGNFAPGALKGSGRTLEVGGAPDTEALPARLVALEKLAIEREGDGRDEDGANAERQEGNLGGFHGACSWVMDVLVCEALGSQYEQSHSTCARRSLLNVPAFTVIDQPPGSVHPSRVNNVTNMSKQMLNGPQKLSVDRI